MRRERKDVVEMLFVRLSNFFDGLFIFLFFFSFFFNTRACYGRNAAQAACLLSPFQTRFLSVSINAAWVATCPKIVLLENQINSLLTSSFELQYIDR